MAKLQDVLAFFQGADPDLAQLVLEKVQAGIQERLATRQKRVEALSKARKAKGTKRSNRGKGLEPSARAATPAPIPAPAVREAAPVEA